MLHFYISNAIFGEKNWSVIYINTNFTCLAAASTASEQSEIKENLAQMLLKTPITVCMCFRHQNIFKRVFFSPVSLVWLCGALTCSQIRLSALASSQPRCSGRCPACRITWHCCCRSPWMLKSVPCPLWLSLFQHQLSGFLSKPGAFTSRARALQIRGMCRLKCDDEKPVLVLGLEQKWS